MNKVKVINEELSIFEGNKKYFVNGKDFVNNLNECSRVSNNLGSYVTKYGITTIKENNGGTYLDYYIDVEDFLEILKLRQCKNISIKNGEVYLIKSREYELIEIVSNAIEELENSKVNLIKKLKSSKKNDIKETLKLLLQQLEEEEKQQVYTFSEVSKILNVGRNTLLRLLREERILTRFNLPYEKYQNYFEIQNLNCVLVNSAGIEFIKENITVNENLKFAV